MPEATAWDIAFLRLPGSDVEIELLEYKGCERRSGSVRPCDYGTGHFALFVSDIEALYADLAARGVVFRSAGPVEHRAGPNARREEPLRARPRRLHHRVHAAPPTAA